ncbi:MAG: enoyl-[acyl-carrier-protein] reductase FabK [Clostridia bacterium]|nr:MAG: enoyl-[acyl-carrier-protein] reductase FabK [Clostridia bacterium]
MFADNPLCKVLGIQYPIIQGALAWISDGPFAAAVSNSGALGVIGPGMRPASEIIEEIEKARALTDKPFGVNVVLWPEQMEAHLKALFDAKVEIITTAISDPGNIIEMAHEHGALMLCLVGSVRHAQRLVAEGADVVIACSNEAGGHTGEIGGMVLVPAIADAVKVPVVASGGIADARGFAAALALGASGVQVGTRFVASKECPCHDNIKQAILHATEEDTLMTDHLSGSPMRGLRNRLLEEWARKEATATKQERRQHFKGRYKAAVYEGDTEMGSIPAGQVVGRIREIKSVNEIITDLVSGLEPVLDRLQRELS